MWWVGTVRLTIEAGAVLVAILRVDVAAASLECIPSRDHHALRRVHHSGDLAFLSAASRVLQAERPLVSAALLTPPVSSEPADGVPDLLTVEEAARVLRIGRTKAYAMAREWRATGGRSGLPVVDFGHVLRVPRRALEEMIGAPISGRTRPGTPRSPSGARCSRPRAGR